MYFSPDGKHLAWVEFNDTEVDVMPLQVYGQPGRLEFQYPIPTPLRYLLSIICVNNCPTFHSKSHIVSRFWNALHRFLCKLPTST